MFRHSLIDAFVAATQKQHGRFLRKAPRRRLIESRTVRRQQDNPLPRLTDGFDGIEDRLTLHHHAFAASERAVIDGLVQVVRPVPKVVDAEIDLSGLNRARNNARLERAGEELRKDGDDIESQRFKSRRPSGSVASRRRLAKSTLSIKR